MRTWIGTFSVASALFLAFACSDEDPKIGDNSGGSGGEAGNAGETGGTSHTGGVDSGGAGAGGDAGGAGGVPPITCEPPTPPTGSSSSDNAGGASGGPGVAGSAGAAGSAGDAGGGGVSGGGAWSGGGAGGAAGSGGEAGGAVASGLAIEGSYTDNFKGVHTVTGSTWTSGGSVYHFASYDNAAHFIIARNDQGNMYSPCLWSRFDWTVSAGELYYCMTAYAAESEEAARATPAADPTDPATSGCGTFGWSKLTPL